MRKNVLSIFVVFCAFLVLVSLGTWQLQRHYWKQGLLSQVKSGLSEKAVLYTDWIQGSSEEKASEFANVVLNGQWLHEQTLYVYAIRKPHVGYLVFTPLKISDERAVFVNRGFVAAQGIKPPESTFIKQGDLVDVLGIVRLPEQPNMFTPVPDIQNRVWYIADTKSMKQALLANVLEDKYYIEIMAQPGGETKFMRRTQSSLLTSIPNRHFEYALTWYGLALVLFCVFVTYISLSFKKT